MRTAHTFAPLTLALSMLGAAVAEETRDDSQVVIGERLTLRSDILDEDRAVWVRVPSGDDEDRYPVLLLLDGPNHFHHTTGTVDFLARHGRIPPMIVVGVANTDRTRDLTPSAPDDPGRFATAGGADAFLRFLTDELTPWVDERYPTRPMRLLMGHSFGGLFGLHALATRPDFFAGIIAISPSLQWDDQHTVGVIDQWLESDPDVECSVYMTVGNEGMGLLGGTHKVCGLLSEKAPHTLRWHFEHHPHETHGSVPYVSTHDGLRFLFDGWTIDDPVALFDVGGLPTIEAHYARARGRFGYPGEMTPRELTGLLAALIGPGRLDDALAVGVADPERYPLPAGYWSFLGDRFGERDERDKAKVCFENVLRLNPHDEEARDKLVDLGFDPPAPPPPVDVPPERLVTYAGTYQRGDDTIVVVAEDGKLTLRIKDFGAAGLTAQAADRFVATDFDATVTFVADEDGNVNTVRIEQAGESLEATRVRQSGR